MPCGWPGPYRQPLILKFEGGYHGMSAEALMSLAPSRFENFPRPVPDSEGIPESVEDSVIVTPYNDIEFLRNIIAEYGDRIAGVIVEPLQQIIPPCRGFLKRAGKPKNRVRADFR